MIGTGAGNFSRCLSNIPFRSVTRQIIPITSSAWWRIRMSFNQLHTYMWGNALLCQRLDGIWNLKWQRPCHLSSSPLLLCWLLFRLVIYLVNKKNIIKRERSGKMFYLGNRLQIFIMFHATQKAKWWCMRGAWHGFQSYIVLKIYMNTHTRTQSLGSDVAMPLLNIYPATMMNVRRA